MLNSYAVLSGLAGRELSFDEQVYNSEIKTAFRNMSIGYMLRTVGVLDEDPKEIVHGYIKQCAIKVTVKDLAVITSILANGGVHPKTGKRMLDRALVRQLLSVMLTCGMYDAAGDWLTTVGIPAKSGVAGGIIEYCQGKWGLRSFHRKSMSMVIVYVGSESLKICRTIWGCTLWKVRRQHRPFCKAVIRWVKE